MVAVDCGSIHVAGLRSDGTVFVVEDGKDIAKISPEDFGDTAVIAIACGSYDTAVLCADGTAYRITGDDRHQLGDHELFTNVETLADKLCTTEKRHIEERRRAMEERHLAEKQREEEERLAAERRAEQERMEAEYLIELVRQETEERVQRKKVELETEMTMLQNELANLKGLFAGKRRKEIEARLEQIRFKLRGL